MTVMVKKLPLARLGVVGGGQLARMLAPACNNHDVQMLILDSLNNSPAGQVAFDQIEGELDDPAATAVEEESPNEASNSIDDE